MEKTLFESRDGFSKKKKKRHSKTKISNKSQV